MHVPVQVISKQPLPSSRPLATKNLPPRLLQDGTKMCANILVPLLLIWTMSSGSASRTIPIPIPQTNLTCDTIQLPFGRPGKALPGFEINCSKADDEVQLRIGNLTYRIQDVSLEGYISIFAGPIHQVCYARDGTGTATNGSGQMDLTRTPFTFSTRNKLTVIGCNVRVLANFVDPDKELRAASCDPYCRGSSGTTIDGSCNGLACCQQPVPTPGAQVFNLSFMPTENVTSEEDGTCSAVFFLDQDEQVFPNFTPAPSTSNASSGPLKDELKPPGERKMTLDWAINSCQDACKGKSKCTRAPSGVGYLCQCLPGYYGNPYLDGGCEDIDECRHSPCVWNCTNTPGSYFCHCPHGMIDDGRNSVTSCKPSSPGSPVQTSTQGLDDCLHPETNPCTYPRRCINKLGVVSCTCPRGMSGDGQKNGSGCRMVFPIDIVLGVGLALVVTVTTTSLFFYWSMKTREMGRRRAELFRRNGGLLLQQRFSAVTSEGMESSAKIFSAEELRKATDDYKTSRILGRGAHGTVYKGVLPDKRMVAVKKSTVFDESQLEQFVNEITILSKIEHPNVVKLLGCCLETQVPLLVYEFISNGTLFHHIHSRSKPCSLTWEDRLRIAAETAHGLAYLHSAASTPIIHRDIKSSNILLDESYVAKISDFGASRSIPFDQTHITTLVQGTMGYLDPEYFQNNQLTEKSDVYSFGVVLAELLTREMPVSFDRPEELRNLAMYMATLVDRGHLLQVMERHIVEEADGEQIQAVAQLSRRCLNLKGEERPTMKEVASTLEKLRTFTKGKTSRRKDVAIQRINEEEEEHFLGEARLSSNLYSSEASSQYSMEAHMSSFVTLPR